MARQDLDIVPFPLSGTPTLRDGDSDFWGPPNFEARFWLENRAHVIILHAKLRWQESRGNRTAFQLDTERVIFDIRSQVGGDWYFVSFREQYDLWLEPRQIPGIDLGLQSIYQSNQGMIREVRAEGDSYGGIFGGPDRPRVEVDFNRIYFTASNDPRAGIVNRLAAVASL